MGQRLASMLRIACGEVLAQVMLTHHPHTWMTHQVKHTTG
jgi:hypothetical protein